ncbi:MAG TPA: YjbQ family protein [Pyrinomonadaceae bacterium]
MYIHGLESNQQRNRGAAGRKIMNYQQQIPLMTKGHGDMLNITEQVAAIVTSSGIRTGTVNVFNVGSTAAVGTIEFEPGLQDDLPAILDGLVPPSRNYGHEQTWQDGNGHSHLQATLLARIIREGIAGASHGCEVGCKSR